ITSSDVVGRKTAVVRGANFVSTSQLQCRFDENMRVPGIFISASEVWCDVPPLTESGRTALELSVDGFVFVPAGFAFVGEEEESLLMLDPSSGPAVGGTLVVLSGSFRRFDGVECSFGHTRVPAIWLSEGEIQCESPPWQEVDQVHVTALVDGYEAGAGVFTYEQRLIFSAFPEKGEDSGGTLVTISGRGLDVSKQWVCWFGLEKTPAVAAADGEGMSLQCLSPPRASSDTVVTLNVGAGYSLPDFNYGVPFTYIPSVKVISLYPTSGSTLGGTSVNVIVQHGFGRSPPPLYCSFGEAGSTLSTWINESAVECKAPSSPFRGKVMVGLYSSSANGNELGGTSPYWYFYPPTVSFVFPLEVETSGSTPFVVTVTGGNFVGSGPLSCRINGTMFSALWLSGSVVECPFVAILPGEHAVEVSNNMVDFVLAGVILVTLPSDSLTVSTGHVAPSRGSTEGGTSIKVFGPDVEHLGSVRHCFLGDLVLNATMSSKQHVECVTAGHEEGTLPVSVCDSSSRCSQSQGDFSFVDPPVAKRLVPNMGSVQAASMVKVETSKGCGHDSVDVWCRFDDVAIRASSVLDDSVTCAFPTSEDGLFNVSVSCNGVDFSDPLQLMRYPEIFVYDAFPLSLSSEGGSVVHVSGRGFQNVADGGTASPSLLCFFDDTPLPAVWVSEALVLCRSPPKDPGMGVLSISTSIYQEVVATVNVSYVDSSHDDSSYILSPTAGTTEGGTVVSITGTNRLTGPVLCLFGEEVTSAVSLSSSEVACVTPKACAQGRVDVNIVWADYKEAIGEFEYKTYVLLSSVRPAVVDTDGGTHVTVFLEEASGAIPDAANVSCRIGDDLVPALVHPTGLSVVCVAPAGPPGPAEIDLWSEGYQTSRGDLRLSYASLPIVSKVNPVGGPSGGDAQVDVFGHNFIYSQDLACFFGNERSTHVDWLSTSQVQCTIPKLLPGIAHVTVSLDGVRFSEPSNASTYAVHQDIVLDRLEPAMGRATGGAVVAITGNRIPLTGGLECLFGDVATPAVVLNQTSLECVSPELSVGLVHINLQYTDGRGRMNSGGAQVRFQAIAEEPTVQEMSPMSGPVEGGTSLVIRGAYFFNATRIVCRLQGRTRRVDIMADWLSSSAVVCTSPRWHQPEAGVPVQLLVDGRGAQYSRNATMMFDFSASPIIEEIHPRHGPESGGTEIRLRGANFRNSRTPACLICTPGGDACTTTSGEWVSFHELRCISPPHEPGLTTVEVVHSGHKTTSGVAQFVFDPAPHVTNIHPTGGGLEGGTEVLVTGTNLAFTGTAMCRFGDISSKAAFHASGVVCLSPTLLTPQKVLLEVSVNGADFTSDRHKFQFFGSDAESWSISGHPTYGDRRGNTKVAVHAALETFTGEGYECVFDDETTPALVTSPSSVTCRSPPFAGERIVDLRVKLADGKGLTASTPFEVFPHIELHSLNPASGSSAGGYTVIVRGTGFVDTSLICCRFGGRSIPAELLSTTELRCVVPPRVGKDPTTVVVEVSHNCEDFYGTGLDFSYDRDLSNARNQSGSVFPDSPVGYRKNLMRCALEEAEVNSSDYWEHRSIACISLVDPPSVHPTDRIGHTADIIQVSPSSGPVEGGSMVDISGLNEGLDDHEDTVFCKFAGGGKVVVANAFPLWQRGTVRCVTPPWSTSGVVLLQVTSSDSDVLTASTPFLYYSQPILYGMDPLTGTTQGQRMIHVVTSGTSVMANATCGFFDAMNTLIAFSTAVWTTKTGAWCRTPVAEPGQMVVEVSANGVDYTQGSGLVFTIVMEPMVLDVSPLVGAATGGTEVVVRGTSFGFSSTAVCNFDGAPVPATIVNNNLVVCTAPPTSRKLPATPEQVNFFLTLNNKEVGPSNSNTFPFSYVACPVVSAISPNAGPAAGGTSIFVEGDNFVDMGNGVECVFGADATPATVMSVNRVLCRSPPHHDGEIAVAVRNDGGRAIASQHGPSFVYNSSLRIPPSATEVPSTSADTSFNEIGSNHTACATGRDGVRRNYDGSGCDVTRGRVEYIRPDNGPRAGGTPVVVTGLFFEASGVLTCHFGTQQTHGYAVNTTRLVCLAPPSRENKSVLFHVASDGRPLPSDDVVYYFEDAPVLLQLQPRIVYQGIDSTDVVVTGEGFRNDSSLACLLGDETIVRATFLSDTSAVCSMPRNVGHVRLQLTNNGVDFSSSGHGVAFVPQPLVIGIDRSAASSFGEAGILLSGLHFLDVPELACVFGEHVFPAEWISAENVWCKLPDLRVPDLVGVTVSLNRDELHRGSANFEILTPPSVLVESAQPAFGPCHGGTVVTIGGSNLRGRGETVCRFGSAGDVVAQVVNASTVRCVSPVSQAGEMRIQVGTSEHLFSAASVAFTYVEVPTVTSLHPSTGVVHGGTRVAILGSNFANTTELECHFGTQPALKVAFVSAEEVVCETAPSVTPTVVPVTVRVNGVASASSVNYRYVLGATVLDVSPHDIYFTESGWVTVTGVNFIQGPDLKCLFNGTISATAQWLSPVLLRCPVPIALRPGSQTIPVAVSNNGQDVSTSSTNILVRPPLRILSVSPARSPFDRSTPVVMVLQAHNQYLAHHAAEKQLFCLFDDEPVQAVSALAPVQQCGVHAEGASFECVSVRCTAPSQLEARNASLRIVDGSGAPLTSSSIFAFDVMVTPSSISPRVGAFGGGTAITIEVGPTGLFKLPETAGCTFADAYDTVSVAGEVSMGNFGSLLVICSSPPWRLHSGHQSLVKLELAVDGFQGNIGDHLFLYSNRANIFALTPRWATDKGGTEIRVRGIGFSPHSHFSCVFGVEEISPVSSADRVSSTTAVRLSDNELLCESPARPPGPAYLSVTVNGEQTDGVLEILIKSSTQVNFLSPFQGPTSGGTVVTLRGSNFFYTGLIACRFGSFDVQATYVNSSSLLCVSPRSPPGVYSVSVAMDGEDFEESGLLFQYFEDLDILSLTPVYGWTTGGTNVTLSVAGSQRYEQDASFICVFGSHRAAAITVDVNQGSMVCSSPSATQASLGIGVGDGMTVTAVSVVDSSGAVSATSKPFHYAAPVTVTAVVPDRGPTGTPVQVLGENFDASFELECLFGKLRAPATFVTSQRVDCHAPGNQTGQVGVSVLSRGTLLAWHARAFFTFEQPVVLLSIDPQRGRHGESTAVVVKGNGFHPSAELICRFGELEASATFINSTSARCLAPPGGRGSVRVLLSTRKTHTVSGILHFLYETEVLIPALNPSEGSLYGGTLLTIKADISTTTSNLECTFTFQRATGATSTSSTAVADGDTFKCKTPPSPGLTVGTAWMSLTQGGTTIAEGASFNFVNPPVVRSVHPQHSYRRDGERVVLSGDNFVPSKELACKFSTPWKDGSELAPAQFISPTKIACVTPVREAALTSGIHSSVEVTTNGADFTSAGPRFTFQPAAMISAVWPGSGVSTGGTPVTITGVAFPSEKLSCLFGTSNVLAWVMSEYKAICISPPMPQGYDGRVPLQLVVDGQIVAARGAEFTYIPRQPREGPMLRTLAPKRPEQDVFSGMLSLPSISNFEPTSCSSSGTVMILVHGSNFTSSPTLACSFGGVHGEATYLSDMAVQCLAPRHMPANVLLEVSNDGATFSASGLTFRFHSDSSILSIDPSHGSVDGSTHVTITGSHFRHSSHVTCRFGDTTVPGIYLSSNKIECWTPPMENAGAAVQVQVSNDNASFSSEFLTFTYDRRMVIASVTPPTGATSGGTEVLITGGHFLDSTRTGCKFGTIMVPAKFVTDQAVLCTTPPHSPGAVSLEVTSNGGDFSFSGAVFTYHPHVKIGSIWPVLGPASEGGTVVTVNGEGFVNSEQLVCKFDHVVGIGAKWLSSTVVLCTATRHRPGQVTVY
ncbi:unnamed protein product, partial [Ectocarpus sp. 12 AP-2014]